MCVLSGIATRAPRVRCTVLPLEFVFSSRVPYPHSNSHVCTSTQTRRHEHVPIGERALRATDWQRINPCGSRVLDQEHREFTVLPFELVFSSRLPYPHSSSHVCIVGHWNKSTSSVLCCRLKFYQALFFSIGPYQAVSSTLTQVYMPYPLPSLKFVFTSVSK